MRVAEPSLSPHSSCRQRDVRCRFPSRQKQEGSPTVRREPPGRGLDGCAADAVRAAHQVGPSPRDATVSDSCAVVSIGNCALMLCEYEFRLLAAPAEDDADLTELPAERDRAAAADAKYEQAAFGRPVAIGRLAAAFERGETEAIDCGAE